MPGFGSLIREIDVKRLKKQKYFGSVKQMAAAF